MGISLDPFSFLVVSVAGWLNQRQQHIIEYLVEENRVLREQIGNTRMRFNDNQHRRLAAKAKKLGRKVLAEVATIVTPETLLTWHRKLRQGPQFENFKLSHHRIFSSVANRCATKISRRLLIGPPNNSALLLTSSHFVNGRGIAYSSLQRHG